MSTPRTETGPDHTEVLAATDNVDRRSRSSARRPFTPGEVAFLIAVPLLWAILLLFHPGGEPDRMYDAVRNDVTPWLVVHLGTMLFIPLLAAAVYVLLRDVEGTAARVSRIALAPSPGAPGGSISPPTRGPRAY